MGGGWQGARAQGLSLIGSTHAWNGPGSRNGPTPAPHRDVTWARAETASKSDHAYARDEANVVGKAASASRLPALRAADHDAGEVIRSGTSMNFEDDYFNQIWSRTDSVMTPMTICFTVSATSFPTRPRILLTLPTFA